MDKVDRYTVAIMELEDSKFTETFTSFETVNTAIEALEKQVAKPVAVRPRNGYILPDYCCPTCGDLLSVNFGRSRVRYCDQCGQRLAF